MRELKLRGKVYQLYDSIDELPVINFQKYNKYVLFDSHIGSDIDAVDKHLASLAKLIKTDKAKASKEIQNLRMNLYFIVNNISPQLMAFAALIHSIDGKKLEDLSEDNLKKILEELNRERRSKLIDFLTKFKKKLDLELSTYFPTTFNNSRANRYYDDYKRRANLMLEAIISDVDNQEEIEFIDAKLYSQYDPKVFTGTESIEIKHDKQFETACMLISQKTGMNAKNMTVLEYYSALENINRQIEAEAKAYKKYKHR